MLSNLSRNFFIQVPELGWKCAHGGAGLWEILAEGLHKDTVHVLFRHFTRPILRHHHLISLLLLRLRWLICIEYFVCQTFNCAFINLTRDKSRILLRRTALFFLCGRWRRNRHRRLGAFIIPLPLPFVLLFHQSLLLALLSAVLVVLGRWEGEGHAAPLLLLLLLLLWWLLWCGLPCWVVLLGFLILL